MIYMYTIWHIAVHWTSAFVMCIFLKTICQSMSEHNINIWRIHSILAQNLRRILIWMFWASANSVWSQRPRPKGMPMIGGEIIQPVIRKLMCSICKYIYTHDIFADMYSYIEQHRWSGLCTEMMMTSLVLLKVQLVYICTQCLIFSFNT